MIYLDNSATTKPCAIALQAYSDYALNFGNASSQYLIGEKNALLIEEARTKIARCINAEPYQIFFTSGGTESNNWALYNGCEDQWIISEIEHPSVLNAAKAHLYERWLTLDVDKDGYVDVDQLKKMLKTMPDKCYVSVMMANNETGAIQPIKELVKAFRNSGNAYKFHTDAVQAVGHMAIDVRDLDVDSLSASGHKFGAFPGVGFLYIKRPEDIDMLLNAGGHQEKGLRGGTYNVPAIVGMADALVETQIKMSNDNCEKLRELLIRLLRNDKVDFSLNTCLDKSLPHIINFSLQGVRSEEMVSYLDANEIYVSSGSACTSGDNKPSHVLTAMGRSPEEANSAIRVSMSYDTTEKDIRTFVRVLEDGINLLRR